MSEEKWAIITGADGGMGTEITRAVAEAGYHIIMACYRPSKAEPIRQRLVNETGNATWKSWQSICLLWHRQLLLPIGLWSVISPFPC